MLTNLVIAAKKPTELDLFCHWGYGKIIPTCNLGEDSLPFYCILGGQELEKSFLCKRFLGTNIAHTPPHTQLLQPNLYCVARGIFLKYSSHRIPTGSSCSALASPVMSLTPHYLHTNAPSSPHSPTVSVYMLRVQPEASLILCFLLPLGGG